MTSTPSPAFRKLTTVNNFFSRFQGSNEKKGNEEDDIQQFIPNIGDELELSNTIQKKLISSLVFLNEKDNQFEVLYYFENNDGTLGSIESQKIKSFKSSDASNTANNNNNNNNNNIKLNPNKLNIFNEIYYCTNIKKNVFEKSMVYGLTTLQFLKKIDKNSSLFCMLESEKKYSNQTFVYKVNNNKSWVTQDCIVCKWSVLNINKNENNNNILTQDLLYPLCYYLYENQVELNASIKQKDNQFNNAKNEKTSFEEAINKSKEEKVRLEQKTKETQDIIDNNKLENTKQSEKSLELQNMIEKYKTQIKFQEEIIHMSNETNTQNENKIKTLNETISKHEKQAKEMLAKLKELKEKIDNVQLTLKNKGEEISTLKENDKQFQQLKLQHQKEISNLKEQVMTENEKNNKLDNEIKNKENSMNELKNVLLNNNNQYKEINDKINKLINENSSSIEQIFQ